MTHVKVTVPESLLAALRKAPHEVADEMRLAAAIHWYQQSALSMERAAEAADVPGRVPGGARSASCRRLRR